MQPDQDTIDALKATHADLTLLASECGVSVIVRPPTRAEYNLYRHEINDDKGAITAHENLVRKVVVWPAPKEFSALLERLPGLCEEFAKDVQKLAGITRAVTAKKL